jgi:hypothetical protein
MAPVQRLTVQLKPDPNKPKRSHAKAQSRKEKRNMNEIAETIIDAAYHIKRKEGPGFLKSLYEANSPKRPARLPNIYPSEMYQLFWHMR